MSTTAETSEIGSIWGTFGTENNMRSRTHISPVGRFCFLLLIWSLSHPPCWGQSAAPIVEYSVGNQYYYRGQTHFPGGTGGPVGFTVTVTGETVIGLHVYSILTRSTDFRNICQWAPPIDTGTVFLERADSLRVYRYDPATSTDILLVDFSDSVGTPYPQFGNGYSEMFSNVSVELFGTVVQSPSIVFRIPYNESTNLFYILEYAGVYGRRRLNFNAGGAPISGNLLLVGAIIGGTHLGDTSPILAVSADDSPLSFDLLPVFPNPFNATATIAFRLTTPARVSIRIFDINGRTVEQFEDQVFDAGSHHVRWDASSKPSGAYFIRLSTHEAVLTRTCLLLK